MLLKPSQTKNGQAGLKLFVLQDAGELEVPSNDIELSYYVLSGRGSFSPGSKTGGIRVVLEPDKAMWVPALVSHKITNSGEGQLRLLLAHCKSTSKEGRTGVTGLAEAQIQEMVGFTSRSIFSREKLISLGASKTIGVDLETLTPRSTLGTHEHEEEILYVLRGTGYVEIAGKRFSVSPGSAVYTGPHIPHSVHNVDKDNFQYLVFEFAP